MSKHHDKGNNKFKKEVYIFAFNDKGELVNKNYRAK
jgi:hypothetical protein